MAFSFFSSGLMMLLHDVRSWMQEATERQVSTHLRTHTRGLNCGSKVSAILQREQQ
jgi:hypothetical protein